MTLQGIVCLVVTTLAGLLCGSFQAKEDKATNILFRSPKAKENEVSRHNPKSSKPNKKDEKLFHLKFNGKDTNKKG